MRSLLIILVAIICFTGCEPDRVPSPRRHIVVKRSITVISSDNCVWCERQIALLDQMKRDGDLKGVSINEDEASERYPATSFPTLYIHNRSGTIRVVGYQDRAAILNALK